MSESERRVGWAVQERAPTLASLRFGLPSPLLAHARGGGMGTTGAASRRTGCPAFAGHDRMFR